MKNFIYVLPLALMFACGDKDEDTGAADTAVEDTGSGAEE
jgi:hypothetical protein